MTFHNASTESGLPDMCRLSPLMCGMRAHTRRQFERFHEAAEASARPGLGQRVRTDRAPAFGVGERGHDIRPCYRSGSAQPERF